MSTLDNSNFRSLSRSSSHSVILSNCASDSPRRRYQNLLIDPTIPAIPIASFLSPPARPGRKSRQNPLDAHPTKSYGDAIIQKSDNTVRLFFQNVKGLSSSAGSEDYRYYMNCLHTLQVDVAGLAETNTCWQHSHLRNDLMHVIRRHYRQNKVVFGSPSSDIDPIPSNETFQAGGMVTMVTGGLVSRVQGKPVSDPTGLGRWTGITLCGSDQQQLTIITAYRICSDSIRNAPLGSAIAREYNYFHQLAKEVVNPRRLFL
jgi:hypothetical protein